VNQAQQKASQLREQAQAQAKSRLTTQKQRATQGLGSLASALDQTSQQLRQQGQESLAQYTAKAADQVEHVVGYLDQRDLNQLVGTAEKYARKHPVTFVAGTFAVGVAAARFLKSSSQPSGDHGWDIEEGETVMQQPKDERSLGDLVTELTRELSTLIRQETALAKTELSEKVSSVGKDVGTMAVGGAVAYAGFLAIVAAVILVLGKGRSALKHADLTPHQTIETLQEDRQWMKEQT
jgi:hypothetical protein